VHLPWWTCGLHSLWQRRLAVTPASLRRQIAHHHGAAADEEMALLCLLRAMLQRALCRRVLLPTNGPKCSAGPMHSVAFEEVGLENEARKSIATVPQLPRHGAEPLAASRSPEVFERFRGRPPSPKPWIATPPGD